MRQKLAGLYALILTQIWLGGSRVLAATCNDQSGTIVGGINCGNQGGPTKLADSIRAVTNTLLFVVGALAVIMIIIGAFQYILSSGDPKKTETAKNTITFAVIGVVVALLAYAIVQFVVKQIK